MMYPFPGQPYPYPYPGMMAPPPPPRRPKPEDFAPMASYVNLQDNCEAGKPCELVPDGQVYCPNLVDPNLYYICAPTGWVEQTCPGSLHFAGDRCDSPSVAAAFLKSSFQGLESYVAESGGAPSSSPQRQLQATSYEYDYDESHLRNSAPKGNRIGGSSQTRYSFIKMNPNGLPAEDSPQIPRELRQEPRLDSKSKNLEKFFKFALKQAQCKLKTIYYYV